MITEVYAKSGLKKTVCSFLLKKATFIIVNKIFINESLHSGNLHMLMRKIGWKLLMLEDR